MPARPHRPNTVLVAGLATALVLSVGGCSAGGSPGASSTVPAPSPTASSDPAADAAFAEALSGPVSTWRSSYLASSMSFAVPGTVVAASVGTGPVARVASGDAAAGSVPLAVDDAFHIGSMTKLFTAALVMQLDEDGVLSLDDTLDRWFPEAPNATAITVRMLLQHESGLAELDFGLVGTATTQQVIDNVFSQPAVTPPGTAYAYLNAGYLILGRIAEKAANIPYGEQVQARFIDRLGLTGTYLDGYGTGPAAVDGFDLGCAAGTGGDCLGKPSSPTPVSPSPSPQWTGAFSAGGMVSTARDQAVWIRDLVAGDVLDAAHRAELAALTPLSSSYYGDAYAKAGVAAIQLGEGTGLTSWAVPGVGTCLGHAGSIPGSNGIAAYCPEADLAIVILNDLNPAGLTPGYPGLLELAPPALKALAGKSPPGLPSTVDESSAAHATPRAKSVDTP